MSAGFKAALVALAYAVIAVVAFVAGVELGGWALLLFSVLMLATSYICEAIEKSRT